MNKLLTTALLPLLLTSGLTTARAASNQAPFYHMVCLYNDTGRTVNFEYSGTGVNGWVDASIRPGGTWNVWWTNASNRPTMTVRFDSDMSDDTYWQRYGLTPYRGSTNDCDLSGSDYRFDWEFSDYIELYDDN
ncbi:hypothetical protein [Deinococcus sp. RIT780]|uniref:hypothetical protein n=1 Tax=Deinococcus sp. RIT780 TaxID=2870472 RepID=UPI001C8A015B|nr:hypothetical protein [Deinococcus sp. RIT780]MBX8463556.1 hypothetical protein [Deinococcus sp. RIT780]